MNILEINLDNLTIWELDELLIVFINMGKEDYVKVISDYLNHMDYD